MLPERSGGNVSYAQHVIFGDPSGHFFVGGTFAHPLHVSLRARVRVRVRVSAATRPSNRQGEMHTANAIKRESRRCIGGLAKMYTCL